VGELVLAGLSGGGGAALYSSQKTRADGSALYERTLLLAPYIDVAIIGPFLGPAISLGMGELKVDFGEDCRVVRRDAGKAGYCNYRLNRIDAMRQVAQGVLPTLSVPPSSSIEIVMVENDGTVTNADISKLAVQLDGLTSGSASKESSMCVATHVSSHHSPVGVWNYIHQGVNQDYLPELVCDGVNFLVDGTALPTDGTRTKDGNVEDLCDDDCDLGNCAYDCNADHFFTCP